MDRKKLLGHQFEMNRARQIAHRIATSDVHDAAQAIQDLANTIAAVASAIDQLIEAEIAQEQATA
jgi:hypothetical protein